MPENHDLATANRQGLLRKLSGLSTDVLLGTGAFGGFSLDNLSDVTITTPATGAVLIYSGAAWVDGQVDLADSDAVTGTLAAANGGTGLAAYAVGDLIYASATTPTLSRLAGVATGNALISGGINTAPSWGKIGLTTHISGTLGAANGGTGVANNAASTITISGAYALTATLSNTTSVTFPTTGTLATLAGSEELDNKTLDSSVGKGTWTASGTWTLPALTAGGLITLSSGQIAFPSTQVPSADANTLDDYEEGTWTPTLTTDGVDFTTVTYDAARGGRYVKVGKLVHINGFLRTDAVTVGSATGNVQIGGLPFTVITSTGGTADADSPIALSSVDTWAGEEPLAAHCSGNSTKIYLYYRAAVTGDTTLTAVADVGTGADANVIRFAGTYIASA
jgi:hypothetical protein